MGTGAWFFLIVNTSKLPIFIYHKMIGIDTLQFFAYILCRDFFLGCGKSEDSSVPIVAPCISYHSVWSEPKDGPGARGGFCRRL
jgi:hypothetical protein